MPRHYSAKKRLGEWFQSLTPQDRLELAEEAEEFRKEARIVRDSGDNEDDE